MLAPVLALTSAALGAYVALLAHRFRRAPTFPDQGWFARVALTASLYSACNVVTTWPGVAVEPFLAVARVQLLVGAIHVGAWLQYASTLLRRASPLDRRLSRALLASGLLVLVPGLGFTGAVRERPLPSLGLVYVDGITTWLADLHNAGILLGLVYVGARFAAAWRSGVRHARLHALALGGLTVMATNDVLVLAGAYSAPYLLDLGVLIPIGAVAYALGARVVDDARTLEALRRTLEAQIAERTASLQQSEAGRARAEKLAALGQLSAGVAHEVNNPAAVLAANLAYLGEAVTPGAPAPADAREVVRESEQAVERIVRIVRQLLDASRLAADAERAGEPVRLRSAAAEAVRLARLRTPADVAVAVEVEDGLWALAQEQLVVQVLANLVLNGAQAIADGQPGHVTIRGSRSGDRAHLVVEDDGAGMDAATLRRVFEPFFTTKPLGVGTGLGLAVSRGLVAGMGGDLRLESAPGVGTRAIVELPAVEAPALTPVPMRVVPAAPRRSLLLVDDDPAIRSALARLLGTAYEVTLAAGTDEGIALARAGAFDVVLCDVMMPDGGAERLCAALDRDAADAARRVVLLTGGATTPAAREFLASSGRPVLGKPVDLAALARVVAGLEVERRVAERVA